MNFRIFRRIVIFFAGILVVVVAWQVLDFLSASQATAEAEALIRFNAECIRRNVNKNEFTGPQLEHKSYRAYHFKWSNKYSGDAIFVSVFYLPFDIESWYIPQAEKISAKSFPPP
jgi:hypothetical protein